MLNYVELLGDSQELDVCVNLLRCNGLGLGLGMHQHCQMTLYYRELNEFTCVNQDFNEMQMRWIKKIVKTGSGYIMSTSCRFMSHMRAHWTPVPSAAQVSDRQNRHLFSMEPVEKTTVPTRADIESFSDTGDEWGCCSLSTESTRHVSLMRTRTRRPS